MSTIIWTIYRLIQSRLGVYIYWVNLHDVEQPPWPSSSVTGLPRGKSWVRPQRPYKGCYSPWQLIIPHWHVIGQGTGVPCSRIIQVLGGHLSSCWEWVVQVFNQLTEHTATVSSTWKLLPNSKFTQVIHNHGRHTWGRASLLRPLVSPLYEASTRIKKCHSGPL